MSKSSLVRQRKSPWNFSAYASFLCAKYPLDLCFKKLISHIATIPKSMQLNHQMAIKKKMNDEMNVEKESRF